MLCGSTYAEIVRRHVAASQARFCSSFSPDPGVSFVAYCADEDVGEKLTHSLDPLLSGLIQNEALARMDDVDDRTRPDGFKILEEDSGMTSICCGIIVRDLCKEGGAAYRLESRYTR